MTTRILKIKLSLSNAYLVLGERPVLVDAGSPDEADKIISVIKREGVSPRDVALILLTHGHGDHAGSAKVLREITGAPVALQAAVVFMARQGRSGPLRSTRLTGRVLLPFVDKPFDAFEPDILLNDEASLAPFGLEGRVIRTPGHTAGSECVLIGDEAIAGDVMMGGYLGGAIQATTPRIHYFAEDMDAVRMSIAQLIEIGPRILYVGHGGPLALNDVARVFSLVETRHGPQWATSGASLHFDRE